MKIKILLAGLVLLALAAVATEARAQVAVIAHPSVAATSASAAEVRALFTLSKKTWSDGAKVVVFDLKADGPVKSAFQKFIGASTTELRKEWMRLQLTGQGQPPEAMDSEEALLAKVAATPGAIGYVSAARVDGRVRVLATIK